MEDRTMMITTEDGKEIICDILFTYFSEEFQKNYVIFQPRGQQQASAASFVEDEKGQGQLSQIETDAEWEMLEELLNDYYNESQEGCGGGCASCGGGCGGSCDGECGE